MKKEIETGNQPEKTFGKGTLTTAIFVNSVNKDGKKLDYRKIQVQKSFKKDDKWEQRKISLSTNELLKLAFYLQKCASYIEDNPLEQEIEELPGLEEL